MHPSNGSEASQWVVDSRPDESLLKKVKDNPKKHLIKKRANFNVSRNNRPLLNFGKKASKKSCDDGSTLPKEGLVATPNKKSFRTLKSATFKKRFEPRIKLRSKDNFMITSKVGRRPPSDRPKYPHSLKVVFKQKITQRDEILKLFPDIVDALLPRGPPSAKWCILLFNSQESLEKVQSTIQEVPEVKMCFASKKDPILEISCIRDKLSKGLNVTRAEVEHAKLCHINKAKPTIDVHCNSTERELRVRFGIGSKSSVMEKLLP